MSESIDLELDTSGLNCPLPILKTKKALAGMAAGQRIHVVATDPGSVPDFRTFSEQTGFPLRECAERDGAFHFVLENT